MQLAEPTFRPNIPTRHWDEIEPFVRSCVELATSASRYSSPELFAAAVPITHWAWKAGMPLDPYVIFDRDVIDRFVTEGATGYKTKASRNTLRSRLLRISEAMLTTTAINSVLRPLGGSDPTAPYSAREVEILRGWAASQSTEERRASAAALLALGLGAGLSGREIVELKVANICVDDLGVFVDVEGDRARQVPVLNEWEEPLRQHVHRFAAGAWAFRKGQRGANPNLITDFISRSKGKVALQARRMRSTWIVSHLDAGTPAVPLMIAAGVQSLEALDRFVVFAADPDPVLYRLAISRKGEPTERAGQHRDRTHPLSALCDS